MADSCLCELTAYSGRNGTHVDDDQPFSRTLKNALWAGDDLFNLRRVWQHGNYNIRGHSYRARRWCELCSGTQNLLHLRLVRMASVDGDMVLCFEQVERHRASHGADADKSDL